jgi:hypothetical protein
VIESRRALKSTVGEALIMTFNPAITFINVDSEHSNSNAF